MIMRHVVILSAVLLGVSAAAAELHPIIEVESGYLFGAVADGKWIKADEAAKSLNKLGYRIYGMTQAIGDAKGSKPKPSEEDVCSDMFVVSLSPKPEKPFRIFSRGSGWRRELSWPTNRPMHFPRVRSRSLCHKSAIWDAPIAMRTADRSAKRRAICLSALRSTRFPGFCVAQKQGNATLWRS